MRRLFTTAFVLMLAVVVIGGLSPALAETTVQQTQSAGLYVSSMRLQPGQPAFNENISFFPTFVNSTNTVQNFTWEVYIYRADTPNRYNNETTSMLTNFPTGTGEYQARGTFRYGATGYQCEYFFARVGWLDADHHVTFFTTPDGKVFEQGFSVCDKSVIPPGVPQAPSPTAPPPTPAPGVIVSDMALNPSQPTFNHDITFNVSFNNTASDMETFDWRVVVFRADTPGKSNAVTTFMNTGFPTGASQYQSEGTFRYGATGYICEYFFARVGWLDQNNQTNYFYAADGTVFQKGFSVCDTSYYAPTVVPAAPGTGLFVSDLALSPAQPAFNQNVSFTPTFANSTSSVQNFDWKVYIYRADTPSRYVNETTINVGNFPVGTGAYPSLGSFRYGPTGYQCEYFFARVGWLDQNNAVTFFTTSDGAVFQKGFSVCDSSIIPAPTSAPPPPTAAIVKPGPGIFVTNVRLQPFDSPQHRMTTSLYVTFQNTTTGDQNFDWRVLIYKTDNMAVSNTDTTLLHSAVSPGTIELQSPGTFYYGVTGNTCDSFVARVGWLDSQKKIEFFTTPDGVLYEKSFQVCN